MILTIVPCAVSRRRISFLLSQTVLALSGASAALQSDCLAISVVFRRCRRVFDTARVVRSGVHSRSERGLVLVRLLLLLHGFFGVSRLRVVPDCGAEGDCDSSSETTSESDSVPTKSLSSIMKDAMVVCLGADRMPRRGFEVQDAKISKFCRAGGNASPRACDRIRSLVTQVILLYP